MVNKVKYLSVILTSIRNVYNLRRLEFFNGYIMTMTKRWVDPLGRRSRHRDLAFWRGRATPRRDQAMTMTTINIGDRFHPFGWADAVYRVIGVRAGALYAHHALLVADTPDQGALAVPLETLTNRRCWLPVR